LFRRRGGGDWNNSGFVTPGDHSARFTAEELGFPCANIWPSECHASVDVVDALGAASNTLTVTWSQDTWESNGIGIVAVILIVVGVLAVLGAIVVTVICVRKRRKAREKDETLSVTVPDTRPDVQGVPPHPGHAPSPGYAMPYYTPGVQDGWRL
jgi:hypothetical protein